MIGHLSGIAGRLESARPALSGSGAYPLVPKSTLATIFGPPKQPRPTEDKILADVWAPPYRGPGELDRYGGETEVMRRRYREQYGTSPVTRAAIRGKADALSCLEVTVLPGNKDDKRSAMAAEWLDYTVQRSPRGWRGIIDSIWTPASIDGYSLCEKKLEPQRWKGRFCWGLAHVRSLDTALLRLQLDVYRNVVGIVNLVRGIEYYSPDDVILHAHNPLFANPFGHSDQRATIRAANIIQDVYQVWFTALKVYGLPYMTGKASPTNKKAMAAALESLRAGGYAVTELAESIEVINLAAAAATDGFERMVHTQREDVFFAIRGASLPFLEGDGGTNAHGDSGVQKSASDAGEYASALDVSDTINRQLVPWLVSPNFGDEIEMPRVSLGGTNWKETKDLLDIIESAQRCGMPVGARWASAVTKIGPPDDPNDKLQSAEEKQQVEQQKQMEAQQQAAAQSQPGQPTSPPEGEVASDAEDEGTQDEIGGHAADALTGGDEEEVQPAGMSLDFASRPTAGTHPPRPGLVFNRTTHRWMRPGEAHDTINAARAKILGEPAPKSTAIAVTKPTGAKPQPAGPMPAAKPITPAETAAVQQHLAKVPEPKKAAAVEKLKAISERSPQGKAILAKAEQWANKAAAKHAAKVAAHLGISPQMAHHLVASTIIMLCRRAMAGEASASQRISPLGGAGVTMKVNRKFSEGAGEEDRVSWVATSRLDADPERFQFRKGHDGEDGTVRELPEERFDPKKCKPLLCWRDPETGEEFVVDGHHRLAWAERDGIKRLPVQWLDAETAEEAKEDGRQANMSDRVAPVATFSADTGERVDVAKVVRELLAGMT